MKAIIERAPPLRSMLAALAIVGLVFGTGAWLYIGYESRIERAFDDRDRGLLAELAEDINRIRIVGIGTSLLRNATLRGDQLTALGEKVDGAVHFARLCRPGGRTPERPDFLVAVAGAKPRVVVFEKTYLFNRPRKTLPVHRYLRLCRGLIRQAILPTESVQLPPDPQTFLRRWNRDQLQLQRQNVDGDFLAQRKEFWSEYMTFGLRPGIRGSFRDLADQQTMIIVVDLPVQEGIPSPHPDEEQAQMEATLGHLVEEGTLTVMRCPLEFNQTHFLDSVHLNSKGQERFSRWFFGELVRMTAPISNENSP